MPDEPQAPAPPVFRHHQRRRTLRIILTVLTLYLLIAYALLPFLWKQDEERHPALINAATVTHTADRIPGDPLNVGLVGSEQSVHRAMLAAGWYPADPITLESSLRIAADVVFKRPFDQAPVSPLYLFGRKEDLAFEKPIGDNPRERHHVRFWRSDKLDKQGQPFWFGSATFDIHVGLSYDTGQITHHISPNIDNERDLLINDLNRAGVLTSTYSIDGFQKELTGKNGGGDPWHTDGRLEVGVIAVKEK